MAELYHLGVDVADVPADVVLLGPGLEPRGVPDGWRAGTVTGRREYRSRVLRRGGRAVLVTQLGVGSPPLAIAVEELSRAGAQSMVLVARADRWSADADLLVPTGVVQGDGTTQQYAPIAYPAVPDALLRAALRQRSGSPAGTVLAHSVDVVDPGDALPHVLATDTLCGCFLVVAAARAARAAAVLVAPAAPPGVGERALVAALDTLTRKPDLEEEPT